MNCLLLQGVNKPLWKACFEGEVEIVEVLLSRNADVNLPTDVRYDLCILLSEFNFFPKNFDNNISEKKIMTGSKGS